MIRHIIKFEYHRGQKLDIPIVWCGRSIPANNNPVSLADSVRAKGVCKNCERMSNK